MVVCRWSTAINNGTVIDLNATHHISLFKVTFNRERLFDIGEKYFALSDGIYSSHKQLGFPLMQRRFVHVVRAHVVVAFQVLTLG